MRRRLKHEAQLTLRAIRGGWPALLLVAGFALVSWFMDLR